ncbi:MULTISPECIES: hypothetical protein [Roseivirga]|jgi:DNA-binding NarL/FixJ family response regulator|uniref:Response regulatory domain-containing protein n=1 Tax=Roseivirga thermotolerans TaxID=1758176 RepID=A0ABQ3I3K1_9BACT|nr:MULTISPECIES: hypothetical protein [Roseivirga]MEC7754039.1 hypothetical protein [Bacteroidota bacterium]GHE61134.1 hypothetical protein GCM10011340_15100 [Roseivirga thermotolerans]|tara:strand:- start:3064 stop:3444 length:381 start_codon:yes stop_codon:yes gene_type:complete
MAQVLLVEDRENLRELFSELIQNYWLEESELMVESCSFGQLQNQMSSKDFDTYVFNVGFNSSENYRLVKQLTESGNFENRKIIVCCGITPPEIQSSGTADIHYCKEDRFVSDCLPLIVNNLSGRMS